MNMLQKKLVSAAVVFSFSVYAYVLHAQDVQAVVTAPAESVATVETQPVAHSTIAQATRPAVRSVRRDDDEEFSEDEWSDEDEGGTAVAPAPAQAPVRTPAQPAVSSAQKTPATVQPAKRAGQYVDGTYTGGSVNVYYGYVQVQAVIQNGRLANVTFLQYPSDRSTSRSINSEAMPLLKQEAIQAQSANVSGVSGASATSDGFIQSLGDALTQARV